MILRLSNPAHRGLFVLFALLIAVFLSYFSIRSARAAHFAGFETREGLERATHLEPGDARSWYLLGRYWQYNLEDPDAKRAIRAYLSALSFNPKSSEVWLDLAAAYESEDNLSAARDAFLNAKKSYPLSADVAWRYGNFLLRQGELEPAFAEIQHAVLADPKRGAEAFSRCLRVEPDVGKILDRAIPPLSNIYVNIIWDQLSDRHTENALKVWERLATLHPRVQLQDSFYLAGALLNEKRIPEASRIWDQAVVFAGLADLQNPPGSVLWDGSFESGITGGGFAWSFPENYLAVQFTIDAREKHSGNHSLRVIFDGNSNVNFTGVCHLVPVQPSVSYRFSAWIKTRGLTTDQGLRFRLRALGIQDSSELVTPDVHGSEAWTRIEIPWSAGKDVQELQVCLARFPSDQPDNKIRGTAWVDDVALVPDLAERSKP
jgi:tetratricopeptide (TPR) repeat protein